LNQKGLCSFRKVFFLANRQPDQFEARFGRGLGRNFVGTADGDSALRGADAALHDVGLGPAGRDTQPEAAQLGILDAQLPALNGLDLGDRSLCQFDAACGHFSESAVPACTQIAGTSLSKTAGAQGIFLGYCASFFKVLRAS
jgi:hypothetical protein